MTSKNATDLHLMVNSTDLHLMVNSFQGICVDLKCFKGKCIFSLKGNIFSNATEKCISNHAMN